MKLDKEEKEYWVGVKEGEDEEDEGAEHQVCDNRTVTVAINTHFGK